MAMAPKKVKQKAVLKSSGDSYAWHYFSLPFELGEKFPKNGGTRRVNCTINGIETFPCALLPFDGEFTIVVNKARRKKLQISPGDEVTIEIVADESKYGMPMPEELQEVLNQDPEGDRLFHALTPGKQRSMMYFIGKFKDIDRRIHSALVLLEHLKKNSGKLIFKELAHELKRPTL
jgi:hypothetical protein